MIKTKKIALKIIGLTSFPRKIPNKNQALFRGAKVIGIKEAINAKTMDNIREVIARTEGYFQKIYIDVTRKIMLKNQPNFLLDGIPTKSELLNMLHYFPFE